MNDISESISEIALKRRQMRLNAPTDNDYSWMTSDITKKRRSSLFETNSPKQPKGFIAELKAISSTSSLTSNKRIKMTKTHQLPVISCFCNGQKTNALLNTTSSLSTINEEFAGKLRIQDNVTVQLIIGSMKHPQQIHLIPSNDVNTQQDLHLGIDFLSSIQGILNFKDNCLILDHEKIPFI